VQQPRVNVVPSRHFTHAGTRSPRLRDYAQLLLQTPATTTRPPANDLYRAVQHRLKLDLTERFKVDSSAHPSASEKAGLTRRLLAFVIGIGRTDAKTERGGGQKLNLHSLTPVQRQGGEPKRKTKL
jgi:hypothetical protein